MSAVPTSAATDLVNIEIDGVAPVAKAETKQEAPRKDWRHWQGRIRTLDARWWPALSSASR